MIELNVIGAGLVGCIGGRALAAALAAEFGADRVHCRVFDQGWLDASYLAHGEIYRGQAGESKAAALASELRALGHPATEFHGNVTRWPDSAFAADVALVGLDRESARLAAARALRRTGTETLVVGLRDEVAVQSFGPRAEDACLMCAGVATIPLEATPCTPSVATVSTRAVAHPAALPVLAEMVVERGRAALAGRDAGRLFVRAPGGPSASARIVRSSRCLEPHDPCEPRLAAQTFASDEPLRDVAARAERWVGDLLELDRAMFRLDYSCPDCGARSATGAALVRRWPLRERCRCGSLDVRPALRLETLAWSNVRELGLLERTLGELGVAPGGQFLVRGSRAVLPCNVASVSPRVPLTGVRP